MNSLLNKNHDDLRRLFSGMVEQVFHVDIGLCDTELTDYLSGLLCSFVHVEQIYALRGVDGHVIRDLSRMEADTVLAPDISDTRRRRLVNKYIGDFTLFWTGVYPEQLNPRRHGGAPQLDAYLRQGRTSYGIASALSRGDDQPPAHVLRCLSENFECCVHGLHLVRTTWERAASPDPN